MCGHGEQRGDPEGNPGGDSVGVKPKADPRHDDQHATRDVDCQQVIWELAFKRQVHGQAAVFACKKYTVRHIFKIKRDKFGSFGLFCIRKDSKRI